MRVAQGRPWRSSTSLGEAPDGPSHRLSEGFPWRVRPLQRQLGADACAWDDLNARHFGRHPLLSSAFVDGLLRRFGDGQEHLCVLGPPERPQAMCILVRKSPWHWASFLPSQAQVGPSLLLAAGQVSGLIQALPGLVLAVDLLNLDPLISDFPVSAPHLARWHQVLTMAVSLEGSFEDYESQMSGGLRQNLRRYERRAVTEFGSVAHHMLTLPDDVEAGVHRYAALEAAGWKGQAGTALAPGNEQHHFYADYLVDIARRGEAEVHELWFGGRLVASRLAARGEAAVVMLKTTYDESHSRLAPGRILLKKYLEHAFAAKPARTVEFYTNATRDQLSWATSSRPIRHVRLYRNDLSELALSGIRSFRGFAQSAPIADAVRVEVFEQPDELPVAAKALLQSAEQRLGVELGVDWFRLMVQHVFQAPARPRIFVLWRADEALAVLPMVQGHSGADQIDTLGNYYTALSCPVIQPGTAVEDLAVLAGSIRKFVPQIMRLTFGPMNPEGVEFGLWGRALERAGLSPFEYFRFGRWTLRPESMNFSDYLATRDGKIRSTLSRMQRRLDARQGHVEIVTGGESLELAIEAYERVYAKSWKRAEPFPGFIRDLIRLCAQRGWLRLGLAWVGDIPIAAQFWIVAHGRASIFKLAYDAGYRRHSPGTLLTARLMEHVLDVDRVREIDYLIGDDEYKRDWMNCRDERWGIVAYSPRSPSGLLGILRQLCGPPYRRLKRRLLGRWSRHEPTPSRFTSLDS